MNLIFNNRMLKKRQTNKQAKQFHENSELSVFVYANLKKISLLTRMLD